MTSTQSLSSSRKSQITLFIILGILLLAAIGFGLFLVTRVQQGTLQQTTEKNIPLPAGATGHPIEQFVEACMRVTAQHGLEILGGQAGYIYLPQLQLSPNPTASDALMLSPDVMPYWYYLNTKDEFNSWRPELYLQQKGDGSVEDQLDRYMNEHLANCTNGFHEFSSEYTITEGPVTTTTTIRKGDVLFTAVYPLTATGKVDNRKVSFDQFNTKVDVKLGEIFDVGSKLMEAEANFTFLEQNTLNVMSLYSGIHAPLPPFSDLQILTRSPGGPWTRSAVENIIRNDILDFVRLIQIGNTLSYHPYQVSGDVNADPNYAPQQGIFNNFNYNLDYTTKYNVAISFLYPGTPIYLSINHKEVIMPDNKVPSGLFFLQLVGLNLWDYRNDYDLSYPVVVTISDPAAFNGRGYTFQIPLEANIRNSVPLRADSNLPPVGERTAAMGINLPAQLVDRFVKVRILDDVTSQPLANVSISYVCAEGANIGETNELGVLTAKFPYCLLGGTLLYHRSGYLGSGFEFNNRGNESPSFRIRMMPLQQHPVKIVKVPLTSPNDKLPLQPGEEAFFTLKRVDANPLDDPAPLPEFISFKVTAASYPRYPEERKAKAKELLDNGEMTQQEYDDLTTLIDQEAAEATITLEPEGNQLISLVPGRYEIEGHLLLHKNITIPEKTICVERDPIFKTCIKDQKLDQQVFPEWETGGMKLTAAFTRDEVYSNKTMVLYILTTNPPASWDDLESMPDFEEQSNLQRSKVRPAFT